MIIGAAPVRAARTALPARPVKGRIACPVPFTSAELMRRLVGSGQATTPFYSDRHSGRSGGANLILESLERLGVDLSVLSDALPGLPPGTYLSKPVAFVQEEGAGLERHCDPWPLVSLQLAGTKTWRFHDARHVPQDVRDLRLEAWRNGGGGGGERLSLRYGELTPGDAEEEQLRDGDFLYLPGYWLHETVVNRMSFSLSFTVGLGQ